MFIVKKTFLALILFLLITKLLHSLFTYSTTTQTKANSNDYGNIEKKVIELSLKLNQAMNKIGKLSCSLSTNQVSANGGWCSKLSGRNSSEHKIDIKFANGLGDILKGKRVASFGDGPGLYKEHIEKLNKLLLYDAFDGAPYAEETTDGRVKFLDLSVPIYHLDTYDFVISVEVAEHISRDYEKVFIDNLVRHAREGVVLSWASVGQNGHSHVNERNFEYVKEQMELRGYFHNKSLSEQLQNSADLPWIKKNVNVFLKNNK